MNKSYKNMTAEEKKKVLKKNKIKVSANKDFDWINKTNPEPYTDYRFKEENIIKAITAANHFEQSKDFLDVNIVSIAQEILTELGFHGISDKLNIVDGRLMELYYDGLQKGSTPRPENKYADEIKIEYKVLFKAHPTKGKNWIASKIAGNLNTKHDQDKDIPSEGQIVRIFDKK